MKIRTEKHYIALTPFGERPLRVGICARLIFPDKSYHDGEIEEITEENITISRSDGNYTYRFNELWSIAI